MTTLSPQATAYLRTRCLTASPAELRMLLLEGAIRFAEQGRVGLAAKDYEAAYEGITQGQDILMELTSGLKREVDPEMCDRLSGLYTFLYQRLMVANSERDPAIVEEVLKILRYERETWVKLMEKLVEESGQAGVAEGCGVSVHG